MSLTLHESIPELAAELETLLRNDNESKLADQVRSLEIVDRCRCDSPSCATIYNVPKPKGAWIGNHRNVLLDTEGLTVLDIVDERIVCIEMLDRDQITQQVHSLLP